MLRVTAHDVPLPYAPSLEDFVLPQIGGHRPRGARRWQRTDVAGESRKGGVPTGIATPVRTILE